MLNQLKSAVLVACLFAVPALAQYTKSAGVNAPMAAPVEVQRQRADGTIYKVMEERSPAKDKYGNADGHTYDLAYDGAFEGQTVVVIDLYGGGYGISFDQPKDALKSKGFSTVRYTAVPTVDELKKSLAKANQFWILASCDNTAHLTTAHQQAIKSFFDAGHGVYIWGDNDPCNADADKLASLLVDARVQGDLPGDQVVGMSKGDGKPGVARGHLLTTGMEFVYEGVTVATVKPAGAMTPIIWGSAGNLVTAAYEHDGKRLIVDGGYTRLSNKWDTAGTGRYIRNAASWLANAERFKDVVASTAATTAAKK